MNRNRDYPLFLARFPANIIALGRLARRGSAIIGAGQRRNNARDRSEFRYGVAGDSGAH
jgi:hypothetical protein